MWSPIHETLGCSALKARRGAWLASVQCCSAACARYSCRPRIPSWLPRDDRPGCTSMTRGAGLSARCDSRSLSFSAIMPRCPQRPVRLTRRTDLYPGSTRLPSLPYRAQDPDLLLWVHATLISQFLVFERLTVGRLDDQGRQRFHDETMSLSALLGLPRRVVPPTVAALDSYIEHVCQAGTLRATEESRAMLALIRTPNEAGRLRSLLASFAAVHTLPPVIRDIYGVRHDWTDQCELAVLGAGIRAGRLLVPRERRR